MSSKPAVISPVALFVGVSSVLVGLPTETLSPPLDPENLAQNYLTYVQTASPSVLAQMLSTFATIQSQLPPGQWSAAVDQQILKDASMGPLARQIIKMWLLGIWYDPPEQSNEGKVISSFAFTRGLLWTVVRAHPTGYSQFSHGYWHLPPPPGPLNK